MGIVSGATGWFTMNGGTLTAPTITAQGSHVQEVLVQRPRAAHGVDPRGLIDLQIPQGHISIPSFTLSCGIYSIAGGMMPPVDSITKLTHFVM